MSREKMRAASVFAAGCCVGAFASLLVSSDGRHAAAQAPTTVAADPLRAELDDIKNKLTDQSHVMKDVGYHFANLWFAAQQQNWPLATFYNQETLSHLHWAVRVIPMRKDNAGKDVDLVAILQAFENSPWAQLRDAIAAQDSAAFDKAYRFAMETCYACHKAADKPFLRPQIPTAPEAPIINFDPAAQWPR